MFEVVGKKVPSELRRTPNDESGVVFTPGNYVICGGIIHKLVCFGEERSRH